MVVVGGGGVERPEGAKKKKKEAKGKNTSVLACQAHISRGMLRDFATAASGCLGRSRRTTAGRAARHILF